MTGWFGTATGAKLRNDQNYLSTTLSFVARDSISKLSMFKTISVRNMSEKKWMLLDRALELEPVETLQHLIAIPQSMMMLSNTNAYVVVFALATDCICVPIPSIPDMVLEGLYGDTKHADVSFVFEDALTQPGLVQGSAESAVPVTKEQVLTAHSLVLTYWQYFQTMFDGELAKGTAGPARVIIKDTSMATFKVLLCFVYTGKILDVHAPAAVYSDPEMTTMGKSSWEDLFLAANRYDMSELCEFAQKKLIACLDTTTAVPFLFRMAYMFPALRDPVVKFVSTKCGA
ncbi:hypothetical protein BGZ94_002814 [Podila epigama]|nr:hypothetical protein BGZ94_002814 [Podila epigama]